MKDKEIVCMLSIDTGSLNQKGATQVDMIPKVSNINKLYQKVM